MANILGPLIGAAVEKKKGKSPVKGAVLGSLTQSAARTAMSIVATALAGYVLKRLFHKSSDTSTQGISADRPDRTKRS